MKGRSGAEGPSPDPRSAGVVIVNGDAPPYRYLLLRAYRYWDFPKGHIEPGENPIDAARREALEETGLSDLQFRWGDAYVDTPPYAGGKIARYYVAATIATTVVLGVSPLLGRPEHHEFRWVPLREASKLLNERVGNVLEWARAIINDRA